MKRLHNNKVFLHKIKLAKTAKVPLWDKCKNCGAALVGTTKCTECEEEND